MTFAAPLRNRLPSKLAALLPWGLAALLGWLAALVCADIAWRVWPAPAPASNIQAQHNGEALVPDLPATLWPQPTEQSAPAVAPATTLPLSLVGGILSSTDSRVVVITTPQGPRVASVGDEIMPGTHIRSITEQGVRLEHASGEEQLSWPTRPERQQSAIRLVIDGQAHTGTGESSCEEGSSPITNISEVCR